MPKPFVFPCRAAFALAAAALAGLLALGPGDAAAGEKDWYEAGQKELEARLAVQPNTGKARNVILFMADGLGVTAATISRIHAGQLKGKSGEGHYLTWETLPHTALVKTYSDDAQITDSAATASAIATGVKTNMGAVSVFPGLEEEDCEGMLSRGVPATLGEKAAAAGKATGVVTTTTITDATPASQYGHNPTRYWASDSRMPESARAAGCTDMAMQLIESDIDIALGGGRAAFFADGTPDPEDAERPGERLDGKDLTALWRQTRPNAAYVDDAAGFAALDAADVDSVLGLFAAGSTVYEFEDGSDGMDNPGLAEQTRLAIEVLSKDEDGFFLLVEHEGTDDLQHNGKPRRMAEAAIELSAAVDTALSLVDLSETLVVFTSDHSQAIAFAGYIRRGNPVFGLAYEVGEEEPDLAEDGKPYTTVGFYTGPEAATGGEPRRDLTDVDTQDPDYIPQAAIPTGSVTHSGDDVPLYAAGPWAHLFGGLLEQNSIHQIMLHAMGIDDLPPPEAE